MAVTPKPRISEIAASGVVALVSSVNSSPLGKNVSQWANIASRAARTSGSRTTSLRIFGSKAIDRGLEVDLETGLEIERMQFAGVFATRDRDLGMAAFVEHKKGRAQFEGR